MAWAAPCRCSRYLATLALVYVYARREGGSRAVAAVALAIPCAAFVPCGAWYDLARPDSLFLALVTAGLLVGWWRRESLDGGIIAALLLVAAFFVKQTAAPFMVALGLALLLTAPRTAIAYGVTLAVVGLPSLWLSNRGSDGWFWTYTSVLHRKHGFFAARAFLGTPGRLLLLIGPGLLLVPWALWRRRSPGLLYATFIGLRRHRRRRHQLRHAVGLSQRLHPRHRAAGHRHRRRRRPPARRAPTPHDARRAPPRLRPVVVWTLLAATLLCAPGGLDPLFGRILPKSWKADALLAHPTGYDPRPEIPSARDRAAGDALIARMRATPGDILIPFHPFYGYLAGKPTFLHRMGVLDTWRAGMPTPARLEQSLMSSRFAAVIMDDKIEGNWQMWPGLLARYRIAERIAGPDVVTGAPTTPRFWLVPNAPTARGSGCGSGWASGCDRQGIAMKPRTLAVVAAALLALLAAVETGAALTASARVAPFADWDAAAAEVRAELQPGDLDRLRAGVGRSGRPRPPRRRHPRRDGRRAPTPIATPASGKSPSAARTRRNRRRT